MGKLNLSNISAGLNKVKSVAESLANVSHFELVPLGSIEPAQHNPFSEQDDDQSRYEVAMSIQTNGLIEPLAVNKKSNEKYTLISGEHRFTAIRQYLSGQFPNVPCMVFEGISDDEAELKLYEANNHREYTAEQKFRRYQELEALLRRMKESGTYHGGIQKGLAERLGVSTRQVRKYQTILKLPEEQQQAVLHGEISINDASRVTPRTESEAPESTAVDQKSGPGSSFFDSSENFHESHDAAEHVEQSSPEQAPDDREDPEEVKPQGEEIDHKYWDGKIEATIKLQYDASDIFRFYIFEVPTTQDAIRDKLKSRYGSLGGSVNFPDKQSGLYDVRSSYIEISCGRKNIRLTYSQIDSYIRGMIRQGKLISKSDVISLLSEKFHMNREG
jgi:ParB/RepB/Spo0J family partition protein